MPLNSLIGTKSSVISTRRSCKLLSLNSTGRGNILTKTTHFIILAISFTLAFSQGKPCCKNKSGKGTVSCKFNQAKIDAQGKGDVVNEGSLVTSNTGVQCPNSVLTNSSDKKKCGSCANVNVKWWQFWAKKKNCCNTKS